MRGLLILNPGDLPRLGPQGGGITVDWRVLTFTVLIAITTGVIVGVIPALLDSHRPGLSLVEGSGRAGTSRKAREARSLLVMTEMALAIVLVIGSALLIRTFIALGTVDRGFSPQNVLTLRMPLTDAHVAKTSDVVQLVRDGVEQVSALPGVEHAGAAVSLPLESDWLTSFLIVGRPLTGGSRGVASLRIISPTHLTVLQVPLLRGRAFTDRDDSGTPPVALVNEALARQFSSRGDVLGDQIRQFPGLVPAEDPPRQIIGIVGDVLDGLALNRHARPTVYVPMAQMAAPQLHTEPLAWVVRTRTDPLLMSATVAKTLQQASRGLPVAQVRAMDAVAAEATVRTTFQMVLMTTFGGLALVLAAIGVYGVMAYTVEQRAHEIGVRLALGADAQAVRTMVIRQGMSITVPGILLGFVAAFVLARVLDDLLFGVTPHDSLVFVSVPLLLIAVAFVAVWLPSQLASRVNPVAALRAE